MAERKKKALTQTEREELLRSVRIFNVHQLCERMKSAFVHVIAWDSTTHGGTFVTAPGRVINTLGEKRPWYEKDNTRTFHAHGGGSAKENDALALEAAFAYAVELTGVPRDQWVVEPFGRGRKRCWLPKPVLDLAVDQILAAQKTEQ